MEQPKLWFIHASVSIESKTRKAIFSKNIYSKYISFLFLEILILSHPSIYALTAVMLRLWFCWVQQQKDILILHLSGTKAQAWNKLQEKDTRGQNNFFGERQERRTFNDIIQRDLVDLIAKSGGLRSQIWWIWAWCYCHRFCSNEQQKTGP